MTQTKYLFSRHEQAKFEFLPLWESFCPDIAHKFHDGITVKKKNNCFEFATFQWNIFPASRGLFSPRKLNVSQVTVSSQAAQTLWTFVGIVQFRIKNYRCIPTLTTHSYRVSLVIK